MTLGTGFATWLLLASWFAQPPATDSNPNRAAVLTAIEAGMKFLLADQNPDGSWGGYRQPLASENWGWSSIGTHEGWTAATTGIVCKTILDLGDAASPEARRALERGLDYLIVKGRPKRISNWDVDNVWGYIYALECVAHALGDRRVASSTRAPDLRRLGLDLIRLMGRYQTPEGGWAYYDDPPYTRRPTWSTSFTTSAALLALRDARRAGFDTHDDMVARAARAVQRCRLPSGAYTYDVSAIPRFRVLGINEVKGSLSRIQVGNLALYQHDGGVSRADLRTGLDQFFRHHKFLAVGRGRPQPHEAYYAVAGYFFYFGHYYAAGVIESLPYEDQEPYWVQLRRKILETQEQDGSMWDFHSHRYHRPYGTAWGVSILHRSLAGPRVGSF